MSPCDPTRPPGISLAPGSPLGPIQPPSGAPCGPEPPVDSSAPLKTALKMCLSATQPQPQAGASWGTILCSRVSWQRSQSQVVPPVLQKGSPVSRGRARARDEWPVSRLVTATSASQQHGAGHRARIHGDVPCPAPDTHSDPQFFLEIPIPALPPPKMRRCHTSDCLPCCPPRASEPSNT